MRMLQCREPFQDLRAFFVLGTAIQMTALFLDPRVIIAESLQTSPNKIFRSQYHIPDVSFCYASACVDADNDGVRDLFFASRQTKELVRLRAADGQAVWRTTIPGEQQSICAFDTDQDGDYEILFTTSNPGRLNLLDHTGKLIRYWEAKDWKLGNSPVVVDADGDGELDAIFGTRADSLVRLRLIDFAVQALRQNWSQCGCHTTAMDVDGDGRWDFFAGSGDDFGQKGILHRFDPVSLKSVWSVPTNDNAASADPVLIDLDGDGVVEIVKSVDNYKGDDNHQGLAAYRVDGTRLWYVSDLAEEDSPNAADLDGDGQIEIVGMTFGGEVYCLNAAGKFLWRRDLRPELGDDTHMYMAPILCDLNGDRHLEILAMTNGAYFESEVQSAGRPSAILFALNHRGEILDQLDFGSPRYFGEAFVCQIDDDAPLELVISGSGGLDVIETRGFGPQTEYFQRRRNLQRLNVVPWAYEDTYFLERGRKQQVINQADDLVLQLDAGGFVREGSFVTELLTPPPKCKFRQVTYTAQIPPGTNLCVNVLDEENRTLRGTVASGSDLLCHEPVRLEFQFETTDPNKTPKLNSYSLAFDRVTEDESEISEVAKLGDTLVIESDALPRFDAPASVALDVGINELDEVRLLETTEGREGPVPAQIVSGTPPRLWWIARGELPAKTKRTYQIGSGKEKTESVAVRVECDRDTILLRVGDSKVLQYNMAHVAPPENLDPKFGRSAYIHPCWTPSGTVVTDQFPPDHAHQSGIFLAYTKTEFQGRQPNFWDLLGGTGYVRFKSWKSPISGPVFGEFEVEHDHVDLSAPEPTVALNENWRVRVWNRGGQEGGYWVCEITSTVSCATEAPLRLPAYHYGGMALRGARTWDVEHARISTAEGRDRLAGNHTRTRWCDLSGPVGERHAGIAFFTHSANFRAPEPLRVHPTMPYIVYTPSQLGDWEILPGRPHISRYQFVFHDEGLTAQTADQLWRDFSEPLTVGVLKQPTLDSNPD